MKTKAQFRLTQMERRLVYNSIQARIEKLAYYPPHMRLPMDEVEIPLLQELLNVFNYREKRDRDRP